MLTTIEFHQQVDRALQTIEQVFEASDAELDLENNGSLLTVSFEEGGQLIFSRQEYLQQLWLAARSGGLHFEFDAQQGVWRCDRSARPFNEVLQEICMAQAGITLHFPLE